MRSPVTVAGVVVAMLVVGLPTISPPASAVVTSTIAVGDGPTGFAKVGSKLFVPNSNSNSVSVIDVNTNAVTATVTVGNTPTAIAAAGSFVYVTVKGEGKVKKINTATLAVTDVGPSLGAPTHGIVASTDESRVFVTAQIDNFVQVITTSTDATSTITSVPSPEGIAVAGSGAGSTLYVGSSTGTSISRINLATNVVTPITVGTTPRNPGVVGSYVYVPNYGSNTVSVVNTATDAVVQTISVGTGPFAVVGSGSHVFVSNATAGTISIIDTATNTVVSTITLPAGASPRGMLVSGGKLYVADFAQDLVRILPTATAVSPSSGPTTGGTSISITGTGFANGATVSVGGAAATSVNVTSDTTITAVTPAGSAGSADVVVTLPGSLSATITGGFTYTGSSGGGSGGGGSSGGSGSGGSGSSGSPSAVEPTGSSPSTPASSPSTPPFDPLSPSASASTGGSEPRLLVGGTATAVTVNPDRPRNPVALNVNTPALDPPLRMRLEGRGSQGLPLGLHGDRVLVLQSARTGSGQGVSGTTQPVAVSSGDGLKANSPVKFYLLPDQALGTLNTDDGGAYRGSVPIPVGISPGSYTLQVNGFAPDGSVRSLNLTVLVRSEQIRGTIARAKAPIFFDVLSPKLTPKAKQTLRSLARKVGRGAIDIRSIGYVQPTTLTSNDQSLSSRRAQAVASFLRALGVRGDYVVRGDGRGGNSGAKSRRVDVQITYRKTS